MDITFKLSILFFCLLLSVGAKADPMALENALAKAQYMLRQVSAEKAQLQKDIDSLTKEVTQLKKNSEKQLVKSEKNTKAVAEKFSKLSEMYEELYNRHVDLAKENRQQAMQRNELSEKLQGLADKHDLCIANNQQLYDMNEDLAGKFKKKDIFDIIKRHEPFTGIAKVQMENLLEGYAYDREGLLITKDYGKDALASQ